jgi:hypothetical protein
VFDSFAGSQLKRLDRFARPLGLFIRHHTREGTPPPRRRSEGTPGVTAILAAKRFIGVERGQVYFG